MVSRALHVKPEKVRRTVDVIQCLFHRTFMHQRSNKDTIFSTRPDFQRLDPFCQSLGEFVVDARLHENAVRRYTGLARVAELGHDTGFDCRIDFGVVKHDERTVAAEFERQFLEAVAALFGEKFADPSTAGETQFADKLALAQRLADFLDRVERRDDVDRALGEACFARENRLGETAQGSFSCWLLGVSEMCVVPEMRGAWFLAEDKKGGAAEHYLPNCGAPSGQGCTGFSCDHGDGEIPWS